MRKSLNRWQAFSMLASGSLVLTLAGCGVVAANAPTVSDAALLKAWHVPSQRAWMHPTVLTAATRPTVSVLPNHAISDAFMWKRADGAITLWGGVPGTKTGELLDLKPGQTLTIGGNWLNTQMPSGANNAPLTLAVNAPRKNWSAQSIPPQDGVMGNLSPSKYTGFSPNEVQFIAKKPGIYTIQGLWDGHWSLPLVVAVGISNLKAPRWPINGTQWAVTRTVKVASLARDPLSASWAQNRQVVTALKHATLHVGRPVDGWLPVSGKVPLSAIDTGFAHDLTVKQTWRGPWDGVRAWTATLPIGPNGAFHGVVRLLVHGQVHLTMELNTLTSSSRALSQHPMPTRWVRGTVANNAPTVSSSVGYLASAADMNTDSPSLTAYGVASRAIFANSPSWVTGIVGVATYASEGLTYSNAYAAASLSASTEDAESVAQMIAGHQAICGGYTSLAGALFRGMGVPSAEIVGAASRGHASTVWTRSQRQKAEIGGYHAWMVVPNTGGALAVDLTGLSGTVDGWSQMQETISLSPSFEQTHDALIKVPDNGVAPF